MPVRLNGSTSGYVELAAPAVADNSTVNVGELTASGLVPVAPSSVEIATGSGSLSGYTTTFTGASSVSLNGVFTAGYDNYRVLLSNLSGITDLILARLRSSGSDNSSAVYQRYLAAGSTSGGLATENYSNSGTALVVSNASANQSHEFTFYGPALAVWTQISHLGIWAASNGGGLFGGNTHKNTGVFDGVSVIANSGTFSGTISVYGYHL